ncbi:MAG: metallophosphoesterase family protein [Longibaculum sp.]
MKFVHIADLHLGKVIHQYSLLDIQRELLFELLEYMNQEDIRILLIAGDIYDRFIPSQEAVNLLDEFLSKALLDYHIEVLMISGNHDSSDRIHFASSILSKLY